MFYLIVILVVIYVKLTKIVGIICTDPVSIYSMLCCRMKKVKIIKDKCLDFVKKNIVLVGI